MLVAVQVLSNIVWVILDDHIGAVIVANGALWCGKNVVSVFVLHHTFVGKVINVVAADVAAWRR